MAQQQPHPAQRLYAGRYRVAHMRGFSALGTVYTAQDTTLHRSVLVYVAAPAAPAAHALTQLAAIRAAHPHPALPRIYDSGHEHGSAYLVCEAIDGPTLRSQGVLRPADALPILRQVVAAVAFCQQHAMPVPPVSSENIVIIGAGQVCLYDGAHPTAAAIALDAAHYCAPELLDGQPATHASTVYALGLLLYEMLTGQRAVNGSSVAHLHAAQRALYVRPLAQVCPHYALPGLATVLRRATARAATARYTDATALGHALDDVLRAVTRTTRRLTPRHRQPAVLPAGPPTPRDLTPPPPTAPAPAGGVLALPPLTPPGVPQQPGSAPAAFGRILATVLLLLLLLWVSYTATSYALARFTDVRLPTIAIPATIDIGLPAIVMPTIDAPVPDWVRPVAPGERLTVVAPGGLNLRDQPTLNAPVAFVVPNGAEVVRLDGPVYADDIEWLAVRVFDAQDTARDGWVAASFLKTSNPDDG